MEMKGEISNVSKFLHNHSEWFDVKCSILEKCTETELFTVVVIGTRCPKHLMPLKATSQKAIT